MKVHSYLFQSKLQNIFVVYCRLKKSPFNKLGSHIAWGKCTQVIVSTVDSISSMAKLKRLANYDA